MDPNLGETLIYTEEEFEELIKSGESSIIESAKYGDKWVVTTEKSIKDSKVPNVSIGIAAAVST